MKLNDFVRLNDKYSYSNYFAIVENKRIYVEFTNIYIQFAYSYRGHRWLTANSGSCCSSISFLIRNCWRVTWTVFFFSLRITWYEAKASWQAYITFEKHWPFGSISSKICSPFSIKANTFSLGKGAMTQIRLFFFFALSNPRSLEAAWEWELGDKQMYTVCMTKLNWILISRESWVALTTTPDCRYWNYRGNTNIELLKTTTQNHKFSYFVLLY